MTWERLLLLINYWTEFHLGPLLPPLPPRSQNRNFITWRAPRPIRARAPRAEEFSLPLFVDRLERPKLSMRRPITLVILYTFDIERYWIMKKIILPFIFKEYMKLGLSLSPFVPPEPIGISVILLRIYRLLYNATNSLYNVCYRTGTG